MKNTNFNLNINFIIYYSFFLLISIFNMKVQVNYYNKIQSQNHKKIIKIIIIINIRSVH